jgi:orotate phosphoribosyltransferase
MQELINMLPVRRGHFRMESGYHGDLWLDLDALFLRPYRMRQFAGELARRLSAHPIEAVCGPLIGGAFLAQMIAADLDVECFYAERFVHPPNHSSVEYHIPHALRSKICGKKVAIVDDAINAGSALRGTLSDVHACGAEPVVIGALLVLGDPASRIAGDNHLPLQCITHLPNMLWERSACPLCAAGIALEDVGEPSQ